MKKSLKLSLLFAATVFTHNAVAYNPGMVEDVCKKPKFASFSLAEYKAPEKQEVAAESEFTFTISHSIDPTTLKLLAKKKSVPFTIENKDSFFLVKSKIPSEYNGQFVRFDAIVKSSLGCKGLDGWLVKVAPK